MEKQSIDLGSPLTITDLPIEVLADQIFKFICFRRCLTLLSYVCKRFDRALQVANFQKQIRVDLSRPAHLRHASKIFAKYQVDTLILKSTDCSLNEFSTLLSSSPRLRTLVVCELKSNKLGYIDLDSKESIAEQTRRTPIQSHPLFERITTLSIPCESLLLLQMFPRVTQLKLVGPYALDTELCFPNIKEIEIERPNNEDILAIKNAFPALRLAYILPTEKEKNHEDDSEDEDDDDNEDEDEDDSNESSESEETQTLEEKASQWEEAGREMDVEIKCRYAHFKIDDEFSLSSLACHDYFNAFGATPLGTYVKCIDEPDYLPLVSLHSGEYEQSFLDRDPLFKFPLLGPQFLFEDSTIAYYRHIHSTVNQLLIDLGLASFWRMLSEDAEQAIQRFNELPINPRILERKPGKLLLKLFERIPVVDVLAKIGKEDLRMLLSQKDDQEEFFLHTYARSEKIVDLTPILDLIDLEAGTKDGYNAATIAFCCEEYGKWIELLKYGCSLQADNYNGIVCMILSDFYDKHYDEISKFITGHALLIQMSSEDLAGDGAIQAIDKVVEQGADISKPSPSLSLMQIVVSSEPVGNGNIVLKHLLNKHHLDINCISPYGITLLHEAIEFQAWQKIEVLLMYGADPHLCGTYLSPLFELCTKESNEFLQAIRTFVKYGADINRLDYDEYGRKITPLAMSIISSQPLEHIEFMIECGAKVDFIDENGNNLIHYALLSKNTEHVSQYIRFFSKFCDVNKRNNYGKAPLHLSLEDNYQLSICNTLIDCGADVNLPSEDGTSPLGWALRCNPYMLQHLLKHDNVDIRARDQLGRTCFFHLNESTAKEVFRMLQEDDFQKQLGKYTTPENVEFVVDEIKNIFQEPNSTSRIGEFFTYHVSFTKYLIESVGIDPNWVDSDGKTLLWSIENFASGRSEDVIDYLVSKGLNINHRNRLGNTVLFTVFQNNDYSFHDMKERQWLLKHGADPTIKNNKGISPAGDIEPKWQHFLGELKLGGFRDLKKVDLLELRTTGRVTKRQKKK